FVILAACVVITFFRLGLLRPLRSTLFPYTTLFRSGGRLDRPDRHAAVEAAAGEQVPQGVEGDAVAERRGGRGGHGVGVREEVVRDRKSTRLNSSHVKISYAVFCLKQKITQYMCYRT